jgi:peptidoglycan/xylan/chitin deacetylase (PgdA/CDA1 family)
VSARALVLTYHAVEAGPAPLCIDPKLFETHLDVIAASGVRTITLDALATELADGGSREPALAITFDDGFASTAEVAAPLLASHGLPATVFCVAGYVGGVNDWPSQPRSCPRLRLASAQALSEWHASGVALGCHGTKHEPLTRVDEAALRREILDSREMLEQAVGAPVGWFAYPYGMAPKAARALVERTYPGACAGGNRAVRDGASRFMLPRVDAHYLRRPALLGRALEDGDLYLLMRRLGARLRRTVRRDFARAP